MASDNVTNTTDGSFNSDVLESDKPVLVDFWATWCGPCKAIAPHVEAVAEELTGKAKVVKMDIDSNPQTPAKYGIRSIPTLLVFKGGEVVDQLVGNPGSKSKIADLLSRHV
ncbi:MAG: thioredoxin [Myxococcota bacterium]